MQALHHQDSAEQQASCAQLELKKNVGLDTKFPSTDGVKSSLATDGYAVRESKSNDYSPIGPELVGASFVSQYFFVLKNQHPMLQQFYSEQSHVARGEVGEDGQMKTRHCYGLDGLCEFFDREVQSQPPIDQTVLRTMVTQNSVMGSVFIQATGAFHYVDNSRREFSMSIFLVRQPLSSAADFVIMNDIFSFTKPREMLVGTPTPAVPVASCVPATITYPTTCGVAATIVPTAPALAYQPPQPCSVVGAVAVSAAVPRTLVTFLAPIPETEVVQEVVQLPKNDIVVPPENGIPTTTSYTTSVPSASAPAQPADSVTKSVMSSPRELLQNAMAGTGQNAFESNDQDEKNGVALQKTLESDDEPTVMTKHTTELLEAEPEMVQEQQGDMSVTASAELFKGKEKAVQQAGENRSYAGVLLNGGGNAAQVLPLASSQDQSAVPASQLPTMSPVTTTPPNPPPAAPTDTSQKDGTARKQALAPTHGVEKSGNNNSRRNTNGPSQSIQQRRAKGKTVWVSVIPQDISDEQVRQAIAERLQNGPARDAQVVRIERSKNQAHGYIELDSEEAKMALLEAGLRFQNRSVTVAHPLTRSAVVAQYSNNVPNGNYSRRSSTNNDLQQNNSADHQRRNGGRAGNKQSAGAVVAQQQQQPLVESQDRSRSGASDPSDDGWVSATRRRHPRGANKQRKNAPGNSGSPPKGGVSRRKSFQQGFRNNGNSPKAGSKTASNRQTSAANQKLQPVH